MSSPEAAAAGRRPLVAGNWKMNGTAAGVGGYFAELLPRLSDLGAVDVAVCVPFTVIPAAVSARGDSGVRVLAQTMHQEPEGAFTGEVSAPLLVEAGADGVVLGHSERRRLFGETDRALGEKVPAALEAGLAPILCVGESEEERDGGDTQRRLRHQVQEGLDRLAPERLGEVVIAYEPVWAIGTGRSADAEQVQDAVAFVRALVGDRSAEAAAAVRILYGGSVKAENAAELLDLPDVDGALVGGASMDPEGFAAIVAAAPS
jgi:triosephosphate isomerase